MNFSKKYHPFPMNFRMTLLSIGLAHPWAHTWELLIPPNLVETLPMHACVLMNLQNPILEKITLQANGSSNYQLLNYEHIPFRCCLYTKHWHLARNCPHIPPLSPPPNYLLNLLQAPTQASLNPKSKHQPSAFASQPHNPRSTIHFQALDPFEIKDHHPTPRTLGSLNPKIPPHPTPGADLESLLNPLASNSPHSNP